MKRHLKQRERRCLILELMSVARVFHVGPDGARESDDDQELLNKVANKISFPALIVDKIFGDDKKCLIESLKESLKVPYI